MATFAIGDVHGCYRELRRLLKVLPMDWEQDHLWLVGDLVNRGPESARVLRWARKTSKKMGDRFQVVLGNHDLHLLAMWQGVAKPRPRDTAAEVLEADDGDRLLRWLASRPLIHSRDGFLLLHAGLWPDWTPKRAQKWARRVEEALQRGKGKARALLDRKLQRSEMGESTAKLDRALEGLVRLRTCTSRGEPCDYTGPPAGTPKGCLPWFEVPGRKSADATVVCGHWAALGLRIQPGLFALDTGCVWGGALTAVRLDDGAVFSQRALQKPK